MFNRDLILKRVIKIEDRLLVSKLLDKAEKADMARSVIFSDFIDPYQRHLLEKVLAHESDLNFSFNGGYQGAERVIVIFRPYFMSEDDDDMDMPLKLLSIKVRHRENLSHRDYLGSLMGLGIRREKIGDIVVREDSCSVIAMSEIAEYIKYNLQKVASASVEVEIGDIDEIAGAEPKVRTINATVASLRLDSVASSGFGMSRSKIADFIKAEKVNLNWETTSSLTKQVKAGDVITIRGKGRLVLERVGGTTKKGRISIELKKYV